MFSMPKRIGKKKSECPNVWVLYLSPPVFFLCVSSLQTVVVIVVVVIIIAVIGIGNGCAGRRGAWRGWAGVFRVLGCAAPK